MSTHPTESAQPRRLPTAAFIVGFGALFIICVILAAGLFNYESGATTTSTSNTSRALRPAPPSTSLEQVNSSVRTHLIANAESTRTYTGIALTGELTEAAVLDTTEVSGHISRLLEQNCLDSVGLSTSENTRVTFTGFCFSTLPPSTLQPLLDLALANNADAIDFSQHPMLGQQNTVAMTWFVASDSQVAELQKTWKQLRRPDPIEKIDLYAYTSDEALRVTKSRDHADTSLTEPVVGTNIPAP